MTSAVLKMGNKIIESNSTIKKIDLLAKLDTEEMRTKAKPAVVNLHLYITQKISNCVAETLGRLGNIIREGVRMKMGMLFLEVYTRLHYMPTIESEEMNTFIESVRKL